MEWYAFGTLAAATFVVDPACFLHSVQTQRLEQLPWKSNAFEPEVQQFIAVSIDVMWEWIKTNPEQPGLDGLLTCRRPTD